MLKIGLTGGIGSGKTTVAHIFQVLGIPVFDADSVAKNLMETDPILKEKLITQFGNAVFEGNQLNRKYLGGIVFNDPYQLELLNAIVHPIAIKAAEDWMEKQITPYVLKEAALLFESGSVAGLDLVVGVFAPLPMRIQRVMQRDGISREAVLSRIDKQVSDTIKMRLCDFVIQNNNQTLLIEQVLKLHKHFLELSNPK
jgi:dephospho-CoA kinase